MDSFIWVYSGLALLYIVVAIIIGRVMRNRSVRYGDYPKDALDGDALAWPAWLIGYALVGILNVLTVIVEWGLVRPLSWIVDKFVPNNEKIEKWE